MTGKFEPPIFIVGCMRSGTSLISHVLDSHSRITIFYESYLYNYFRSELRYYGDPQLYRQAEEWALAAGIDSARQEASAAVAREDFAGAMAAIAKLRPAVDAFFDKVTVNVDEPAVRANRLKLLNQIREATLAVADFSKIEG